MTKLEMIAFEAGRTSAERGLADKAPCYDPILDSIVTNARSEAGHKRNERILKAWYKGAGRELPKRD